MYWANNATISPRLRSLVQTCLYWANNATISPRLRSSFKRTRTSSNKMSLQNIFDTRNSVLELGHVTNMTIFLKETAASGWGSRSLFLSLPVFFQVSPTGLFLSPYRSLLLSLERHLLAYLHASYRSFRMLVSHFQVLRLFLPLSLSSLADRFLGASSKSSFFFHNPSLCVCEVCSLSSVFATGDTPFLFSSFSLFLFLSLFLSDSPSLSLSPSLSKSLQIWEFLLKT